MMNPSVHPQHEVVIDASAIGHRRSSSLASATASKPESHMTTLHRTPIAQGLYDPSNEHDACGVGFVVNIKGKKRKITGERTKAAAPKDKEKAATSQRQDSCRFSYSL